MSFRLPAGQCARPGNESIRFEPREKFDAPAHALGDAGSSLAGEMTPSSRKETGGLAAHVQMDVARARLLGLANQALQHLQRGGVIGAASSKQ